MAVKHDNFEMARELLQTATFDPDLPKFNGVNALGIACMANNMRMVRLLDDSKADMTYTTPAGIGAMFLAIKGKAKQALEFLIAKKVPIYYETPAKMDNSPLFYAFKTKFMPALELFCDLGVENLNFYINSQGQNVMIYAA